MSRPSIRDGRWIKIENKEQHKNVLEYGKLAPSNLDEQFSRYRVQIGKFIGSGWYILLSYNQPCPRGCCRDSVSELIPNNDGILEIKEEMTELANVLKKARQYQNEQKT